MRINQTPSLFKGWKPAFEVGHTQKYIEQKHQRAIKLHKDMRDKVRARRAEDLHIMELAEYHYPFLEA